MAEKKPPRGFILSNLKTFPISVMDPRQGDHFENEWLRKFLKYDNYSTIGKVLVSHPPDQHLLLDYTTKPGGTSGVFYSLCFWLRKNGWQVHKASESIEVSPMHQAYYQVTHKQKEDLENKIKGGFASVSQSIAEFELLRHDERKYREFLRYFGFRTKKEISVETKQKHEFIPDDFDDLDLDEEDDKAKKRRDEHALKAVFIDQVDMHTGDVSIRNIVQRWPTLIVDFMSITDDDMDPGKLKDKLKISKAEAVVLITKNKLYNEWKNMFLPEMKLRYRQIKELIRSREQSIKEYREWVKPYIARHRMISEGLASSGGRMGRSTLFVTHGGHAVSMVGTEMWAWREFEPPELQRRSGEISAYMPIKPDDPWMRRELIWNPDHGLVSSYQWITKKWVEQQIKDILNPTTGQSWMMSDRLYYSFDTIVFDKTNIRFPDGSEVEDGMYYVYTSMLSQNAMLAKLLELKAKQYEMEIYVNKMLGIKTDDLKLLEGPKEKYDVPLVDQLRDKIPLTFFRKGPYLSVFYERGTRVFMLQMGRSVHVPITNFIKQKMGMGKVG